MKLIGMIVPSVSNSFFSSLVSEVERFMFDREYQTLICSSDNNAEKEKMAFSRLADLQVKGIICVSGLRSFPEDLLPIGFPLVWVDRVPKSERKISWVVNDDAAAMEKATEYLIEKGCKNILLLPGYLAEHQESPRTEGYRRALLKHEIPWRQEFVLTRSGKDNSEVETEELIRDALKKGIKIDGIITSSDRAAFGAMARLRSVGLYVPEDVRLISFDNSPYSNMATPSITALDRKPKLLAEKACENLIAQLNRANCISENVIHVSLVERVSTR